MRISTKVAADVAATALVVSAAAVTLGATSAGAATTCSATASATKNDISTLGITMTYNKSVNPTTAADSSIVTYSIVVGTTGIGNPYVNTIVDYPPAGFGAPVAAAITSYHLGSGEVSEAVTPTASGTGWAATSSGWFVNASNPVTFTVTYQVPASTPAGPVTSGGISVSGTVGVSNSPALDVCFSATTAATTTTTAPPTTTTTPVTTTTPATTTTSPGSTTTPVTTTTVGSTTTTSAGGTGSAGTGSALGGVLQGLLGALGL